MCVVQEQELLFAVVALACVAGFAVCDAASSPSSRSPNAIDRLLPASWADPVHGVSLRWSCRGWILHVHHWLVFAVLAAAVAGAFGASPTPLACVRACASERGRVRSRIPFLHANPLARRAGAVRSASAGQCRAYGGMMTALMCSGGLFHRSGATLDDDCLKEVVCMYEVRAGALTARAAEISIHEPALCATVRRLCHPERHTERVYKARW